MNITAVKQRAQVSKKRNATFGFVRVCCCYTCGKKNRRKCTYENKNKKYVGSRARDRSSAPHRVRTALRRACAGLFHLLAIGFATVLLEPDAMVVHRRPLCCVRGRLHSMIPPEALCGRDERPRSDPAPKKTQQLFRSSFHSALGAVFFPARVTAARPRKKRVTRSHFALTCARLFYCCDISSHVHFMVTNELNHT